MQTSLLSCTKCRVPLPVEFYNQPTFAPCPSCASKLQVEIFPAFVRQVASSSAESIVESSVSACFYHPQKKAVVPCDSCGRFLCALCDVDFNHQHLCPGCLDTGKKKDKILNLQIRRVRYDNLALALAIFPLLIFYFTFITAPMALYFAIRYWNAPGSITPCRPKIRFVIASILATLQILGWCIGIYFLVNHR